MEIKTDLILVANRRHLAFMQPHLFLVFGIAQQHMATGIVIGTMDWLVQILIITDFLVHQSYN